MNVDLWRKAENASIALVRGRTRGRDRVLSVGTKAFLDFTTASYLGLDGDEEILRNVLARIGESGLGRCASPLYYSSEEYSNIERRLREILGFPGVVLFNSNTLANNAAVSLVSSGLIYVDEFAHRSIFGALRRHKEKVIRYPHCNVDALEEMIRSENVPPRSIITDGVFSMSGGKAPIERLWDLANRYSTTLLIDDAHGFAVTGRDGRGSIASLPRGADNLIVTGSLTKALAGFGGFIVCSQERADRIHYGAAEFGFSCAIPDIYATAAASALAMVGGQKWELLVRRLGENIGYLDERLKAIGRCLLCNNGPIAVIDILDEFEMQCVCLALKEAGILFNVVAFPAIRKGSFRLRFCMSAAHSLTDIERLAAALEGSLIHNRSAK